MLQFMLKAKIHRATITDADLNYEGSLSVDKELLDAAGLVPYEQIKIYNINNGSRIDTYLIEGEAGSGVISLNGAAARKGAVGDLIIIASYGMYSPDELEGFQPKVIVLNPDNTIKSSSHS